MNQISETNNYFLKQIKQEEDHLFFEEPKEEEIYEEQQDNVINSEEKNNIMKKIRMRESTFKRLKSLPKKYQTYKMDYKKQLVEEVNV